MPPKYAWATRIEWQPVAWNNGTGTSTTGGDAGATGVPAAIPARSLPRAPTYMRLTRLEQMLRWVPRTPFGRPVVPDV